MAENPEQAVADLEGRLRRAHGYFAGVLISAEGSIEIYWKGGDATVPEADRRHIDELRGTGRRVQVRAAVYSLSELEEERRRIREDPAFASSGIGVMSPEPDGSGLFIGGSEASARKLASVKNSEVALHFDEAAKPRPAHG